MLSAKRKILRRILRKWFKLLNISFEHPVALYGRVVLNSQGRDLIAGRNGKNDEKRSFIALFIPENFEDDVDKRIRAVQLVTFCLISPAFFIPNIIKWSNLGSRSLAVSMVVVMAVVLTLLVLFKKIKSLGVFANLVFKVLAWHFISLPL